MRGREAEEGEEEDEEIGSEEAVAEEADENERNARLGEKAKGKEDERSELTLIMGLEAEETPRTGNGGREEGRGGVDGSAAEEKTVEDKVERRGEKTEFAMESS